MNEELKADIVDASIDFWITYNYNCHDDDYGLYDFYNYEEEWLDEE